MEITDNTTPFSPTMRDSGKKWTKDILATTLIGSAISLTADPRNMLIGLIAQKIISSSITGAVVRIPATHLSSSGKCNINSLGALSAFWAAREISSSCGYPVSAIAMFGAHTIYNLARIAYLLYKESLLVAEAQNYNSKTPITELNSQNFKQEVLDYDGPIVIDAYTPTCGPCKIMEPIFNQLSSENPSVKFLKLNVAEELQIAEKFNFHGAPTFIFIEKGHIVHKMPGTFKKDEISSHIQANFSSLGA